MRGRGWRWTPRRPGSAAARPPARPGCAASSAAGWLLVSPSSLYASPAAGDPDRRHPGLELLDPARPGARPHAYARQLPGGLDQPALPRADAALLVDLGRGDGDHRAPCLSDGLFPGFLRDGRRKMLWLILISIPFWTSYLLRVFAWKVIFGYQRRDQFRPHQPRPDRRAAGVPALQPDRGGDDARPRLGGVYHPPDLRLAREDRPLDCSRRPPISATGRCAASCG